MKTKSKKRAVIPTVAKTISNVKFVLNKRWLTTKGRQKIIKAKKEQIARRKKKQTRIELRNASIARIRALIDKRVNDEVTREVGQYREYMQNRLDSRDAFINMLCSALPEQFIKRACARSDTIKHLRPK